MKKINDSTKIVKLILKAISLTKKGYRLDVQCHTRLNGYMFLGLYWDEDGFSQSYSIQINER